MAVKNISTRAQICGRGAGCHGGHSAIKQSGYISREEMYSEYDGLTYYPKYSEDLVHGEVMLPKNAPEKYKDPSVLWNSVEMNEKGCNAQLARTFRAELPNEWTYELAIEEVRRFAQRNFVDKGMCVQFAIHDSENKKTGQRNLHVHFMMTLRGIDENGKWIPKQKKVYITDENGERIPLIDQKTGLQKVDKNNRKQWKCTTTNTNDWNSKEYVKAWRKDLVDTINEVNKRLGMTENFWEHRSFAEQGLDKIPQIHLGEKASALERAGVKTTKGDYNREIIARNAIIESARIAVVKAKQELEAIKAIPVTIVNTFKSEIIDVIRKMAQRNNNRLTLPIVKGRFIGSVSDRAALQDKDKMESYVRKKGWKTFAEMRLEMDTLYKVYDRHDKSLKEIKSRIGYLESLLDLYRKYEPYQRVNEEYWKLKKTEEKNKKPLGFLFKSKAEEYKENHQMELNTYTFWRNAIKYNIVEPDKKIAPIAWRKELKALEAKYDRTEEYISDIVTDLAKMEVLNHNKNDLERMIQNEHAQKDRDIIRTIRER